MSSRPAAAVVLLLVASIGLAACGGLTKSPAEGTTFKAPESWKSTPGIMGMMQFWVSPDEKQTLMLFKVPADWRSDQAFSSADMKDSHVTVQRDVKICGDRPATFIQGVATSSRTGDDDNFEMVVSKAGDGSFMAMYVYPIGARTDPAANAAIYELCPAKT